MEESDESGRTLGGIDFSAIPEVEGTPNPGQPPYTRGIHSTMYRSRRWTMRQYAGFSTAEATNQRFKLLLSEGQKGLSVAFDLPTQLGMDSDDPLSYGEVGKVGVAIDSIDDMRRLFDGIDLSEVSTSMTINAPAAILFALYVAVAEEKGVHPGQLRGTIQNDVLKEYIARGLYVFPPEPSLRLATDVMRWCAKNAPAWNTISISGYHIREAGSTAIEEVAFTLANALQYADSAIDAGLDIDEFAPRMSFFFGCHNDFFEEIAKFRAARTLWHDLVQERYSPEDPRSARLRFHTQTAGVTLTAQQPMNNVVRVAYQAMAAVLGGTQSLHTNAYDEALGLPTEDSVTIALRTQQILSEETGIPEVVDPLAGSVHLEHLTEEIVRSSREKIEAILASGGAMEAIKRGEQQRSIHESAWSQLTEIESAERRIIGVNYAEDGAPITDAGQSLDPALVEAQLDRIDNHRKNRNHDTVKVGLESLKLACESDDDLFPQILNCVRNGATVGEVMSVMREVFGTWRAPSGI
ncbi:MAG: methylmalonyl-CoA mutase family protein [Candidatus Thermoplasmatota archaeon]|nr:methylmalonyl-CoA mutase family protein [Candidatus Thermoplasmatota archaeon]